MPKIKVANLRAFNADNTKNMPSRHPKSPSVSGRHDHLLNEGQAAAHQVVEILVVSRDGINCVNNCRLNGAPLMGI
jgi:hypothetical protein